MTRMQKIRRAGLAVTGAAALVLAIWWGPFIAFHLLPPDWTGEADRLAEALRVTRGMRIAEIGAGAGAMSLAIARRVGDDGLVYAAELSASRREGIARAVADAGAANVVVVTAEAQDVGLEEQCCDAIFMRNVFHHIEAPAPFAAQLRRALRPGGRLAVIDFPPGSLAWHLGPEHGSDPDGTIRTFVEAGFRLETREPDWGGRTYMVSFQVED